jgi:hypothetical protein
MKKFRATMERFSFAQLTSNSDGKTSGSGTAGLYIVFIGGVCFFLGCVDKMFLDNSVDIINQSIMMVTIGAGLLGIKNITGGKNQFLNAKAEQIKSETEESQQ